MRLSEWRTRAPHKDSMTPKVAGRHRAGADRARAPRTIPSCWVVWGDDPGRALRPPRPDRRRPAAGPGPGQRARQEGPRARRKLIRWNRVQLGELALEMAGGHRLLGFQVEGHVLRGVGRRGRCDGRVRAGAVRAVDGRPFTPPGLARAGATGSAARPGGTAATAKSAAREVGRARTSGAAKTPLARPPARRPRSRPPNSEWPRGPTRRPRRPLHPFRRTIRYWASRLVAGAVTRAWLRIEVEGSSGCRMGRRSIASTTCRGRIRSC